MKFKVIQDGKEIICDVVMTFSNNNIDYIVYTDGTKDENGDLEVYASRYVMENNQYILNPIEEDSEWDLVDEMLETTSKEVN